MRFPYYVGALSHLQCVLFEFPLHKSLTMMTNSPIHSSQFYIYSLLSVVLSVEAEDMTEVVPRTSLAELWSVDKNRRLRFIIVQHCSYKT